MANPDEIIHQSLRLRIMAAPYAARDSDPIEFVGKKPRTRAAITRAGTAAFLEHISYLRSLIDSANL